MKSEIIKETGNRYGKLVVLGRAKKPVTTKQKRAFWLCWCDCGEQIVVAGSRLRNGTAKSCGCLTRWDRGRIIDAIKVRAQELQRIPKPEDFLEEGWGSSFPSAGTILNRFGTFNKALTAAGFKPRIHPYQTSDEISRRMKEWHATHEHPRKGSSGKHYNVGSSHPSWQGGISFEHYPAEFSKRLKRSIHLRDNFTYQNCFCEVDKKTVTTHHVDYDKKNQVYRNLITLCRSCHSKTNFNRDYWRSLFQQVAVLSYQYGGLL